MDTVRELSKPGQALAPNAATATTNNPAWWIDGEVTPSRLRLHRRLLEEARDAAPDVEQQRRAVVLAGPPGAGKSTVLEHVLGEHRGKYLVIDADEFKRSLLREAQVDGSYDQWLVPDAIRDREAQGERFYPLELASLVHEESSHLAKSLRTDAIAAGDNIVIDTVLSNESDALALGQRLHAAGYDVRVIDVEVSYELCRLSVPPDKDGAGSEDPLITPSRPWLHAASAHLWLLRSLCFSSQPEAPDLSRRAFVGAEASVGGDPCVHWS